MAKSTSTTTTIANRAWNIISRHRRWLHTTTTTTTPIVVVVVAYQKGVGLWVHARDATHHRQAKLEHRHYGFLTRCS